MANDPKFDSDNSPGDDDREAPPAVAEEAENYERNGDMTPDAERLLGKSLVGSGDTPNTDTE